MQVKSVGAKCPPAGVVQKYPHWPGLPKKGVRPEKDQRGESRPTNRPVILKYLLQKRVAAAERDSAELACIASGYPAVTFAWSFNGSTISAGQSDSLKYSVRQRRKHGNEWWSTLMVKSITEGDYGVYTCIAGNQMGHDFVPLNIVKRSIPDPPEALESLNVSHQGALLVWAPGFDGGLPQSYQLRIQKNKGAPVSFVHIPMNTTSYLLSGLEQGTVYEVSISAKNALGESLYTPSITFKTKSLPVMDSTISGPVSGGSSSVEFLPAWLLAAAVIGGLVVVANVLVCIIYIRRKRWCRNAQASTGSAASDDEVLREKMVKKIPSEDRSPFYLTGTSVDMPVDGLDVDTFQQKPPTVKLHQVSRESSEDGQSSGRRCDCGGRQWSQAEKHFDSILIKKYKSATFKGTTFNKAIIAAVLNYKQISIDTLHWPLSHEGPRF
ncbi:Nephrin [Araneus ventricosus]|uniref:Nephrin n=1 Tax=Araneus ventricosus TaxID=182803 RepID=A0A4Y2A734_ARAVE|nr:Nephrin [Araneus ventricosus]